MTRGRFSVGSDGNGGVVAKAPSKFVFGLVAVLLFGGGGGTVGVSSLWSKAEERGRLLEKIDNLVVEQREIKKEIKVLSGLFTVHLGEVHK